MPQAKYIISFCDGSSVYIPYAEHIERNDNHWPRLQFDDFEAAKIAESEGVRLIYGMEDVEDGIYIDTPENRRKITESLSKFPEYRLVKQYGCIPDTEEEKNNFGMEDSTMYGRTKTTAEPPNVEKLQEELTQCVTLQETMKAVNAHWRKTGTCMGAPGITDEQAKKMDDKIVNARYEWDRQPFSSYTMTNNNSQIKRLQQKLAEVSRGFAGWEFNGGHAEANTEMNRLQLFFDERPTEQQRAQLKANGFKWAPSQDAWQRQLTDNAIYSAGRLDFIKPSDGRTVREHQPKPPARDNGAR